MYKQKINTITMTVFFLKTTFLRKHYQMYIRNISDIIEIKQIFMYFLSKPCSV